MAGMVGNQVQRDAVGDRAGKAGRELITDSGGLGKASKASGPYPVVNRNIKGFFFFF